MIKLSVVLATRNEEENIGDCIELVKDIADEIIVVDEYSKDKTRDIAKKLGAKVYLEPHHQNFHITKKRALILAKGEWVLQLDADERVTPELSQEILKVVNMTEEETEAYQKELSERVLFERHIKILEEEGRKIGTDSGEYAGFFIPRLNFFLGKYLKHGGVYPDGVIRLVKNGMAEFPAESVHEQIRVNGKVGWLGNPLKHMADKTFKHYLKRNSYYIDLISKGLKEDGVGKNPFTFINYVIIKPIWWFFLTQIRHKGILDGWQGIVFSFFSALRFSRAFIRYLKT
ncbi:glycosyltransferase family 2 protein [Patescibacteria group bacterium]